VKIGKESIGADQQACSSGESSKKEQLPLGSSQLPPFFFLEFLFVSAKLPKKTKL
jgi:hypothetical protein